MHLQFDRQLSATISHRARHIRRHRVRLLFATLFFVVSFAARAEESMFGFVYTTDLLPKGGWEIEQWMTWRHQKNNGYFDQLEGRTELEYGLTDQLQVALYANYAWTRAYHNGPFGATTPSEQFSDYNVGPDDRFSAARFIGVSGYRILSPYTDPVGLALYTEPTVMSGIYRPGDRPPRRSGFRTALNQNQILASMHFVRAAKRATIWRTCHAGI